MPEISNLETLSVEEKLSLIAKLRSEVGGSDGSNPMRKGRTKQASVLYLTEEELAGLFRAIDAEARRPGSRAAGSRDRALFEVALGRGLRASEVGLLEMKHLRMKEDRLYVTRLKGGRTGEFLITERESRALKPYLKDRGWLPGPLFTSRKKRAISRRRLDELMKFYGQQAGLPQEKRHFHCMRHTCATRLLDHGVSIEEVQDILGHEDIRNTMIYAKITNVRRMKLGARLRESW
jgi:type 1 fimbriae regulatory protein FimB